MLYCIVSCFIVFSRAVSCRTVLCFKLGKAILQSVGVLTSYRQSTKRVEKFSGNLRAARKIPHES